MNHLKNVKLALKTYWTLKHMCQYSLHIKPWSLAFWDVYGIYISRTRRQGTHASQRPKIRRSIQMEIHGFEWNQASQTSKFINHEHCFHLDSITSNHNTKSMSIKHRVVDLNFLLLQLIVARPETWNNERNQMMNGSSSKSGVSTKKTFYP